MTGDGIEQAVAALNSSHTVNEEGVLHTEHITPDHHPCK